MTYKKQFEKYLRDKIAEEGPISIHIEYSGDYRWDYEKGMIVQDRKPLNDEEDLFEELMRIVNSTDVADVEVLGKYSPKFW